MDSLIRIVFCTFFSVTGREILKSRITESLVLLIGVSKSNPLPPPIKVITSRFPSATYEAYLSSPSLTWVAFAMCPAHIPEICQCYLQLSASAPLCLRAHSPHPQLQKVFLGIGGKSDAQKTIHPPPNTRGHTGQPSPMTFQVLHSSSGVILKFICCINSQNFPQAAGLITYLSLAAWLFLCHFPTSLSSVPSQLSTQPSLGVCLFVCLFVCLKSKQPKVGGQAPPPQKWLSYFLLIDVNVPYLFHAHHNVDIFQSIGNQSL